jgi:hypothetical protein
MAAVGNVRFGDLLFWTAWGTALAPAATWGQAGVNRVVDLTAGHQPEVDS